MGQKGIKISVHWTRTLISDIVYYANKVPLCTIEKKINIEDDHFPRGVMCNYRRLDGVGFRLT